MISVETAFTSTGTSMDAEFRQALKAARIARGLTQGALADAIGLSKSTISMIESGNRDTTGSHLAAWASVCRVRLSIVSNEPNSVDVGHLSAQHQALVRQMVDIIGELHPAVLAMVEAAVRKP